MKPKSLILVGAICAVSHALLLIPALQGALVQGILLALLALIILAFTIFSGEKDKTTPDACQSLCSVIFYFYSYTILFNAFCMLISHDSLWTVSIFQSIFFPIILSGFIGYYTPKKHYRHCSIAALVVALACCCYGPDMSVLIPLAILSNVICLIIPAGISLIRSRLPIRWTGPNIFSRIERISTHRGID